MDGPPPGARRGKGDPANRTADPRVSELEFAPDLLVRSPAIAEAYGRQFVAGGSWNTDPAYSMRVTGQRQLVVVQTPWVLDELEALMKSWKPAS